MSRPLMGNPCVAFDATPENDGSEPVSQVTNLAGDASGGEHRSDLLSQVARQTQSAVGPSASTSLTCKCTLRGPAGACDARARVDQNVTASVAPRVGPVGRAVAGLWDALANVARCRRDGCVWYLPHPESGLSRRILERRGLPTTLEIDNTHALGAHGGTMLDIGANIGTSTIPRIRRGHFRRSFCAEPQDLDFTCLVWNVVANGLQQQVFPDQRVIFSSSGLVAFRTADQSGVHRVVLGQKAGRRNPRRSVMLDKWLRQCNIAPTDVDFVKCDAQGAKGHVFSGGRKLSAGDTPCFRSSTGRAACARWAPRRSSSRAVSGPGSRTSRSCARRRPRRHRPCARHRSRIRDRGTGAWRGGLHESVAVSERTEDLNQRDLSH